MKNKKLTTAAGCTGCGQSKYDDRRAARLCFAPSATCDEGVGRAVSLNRMGNKMFEHLPTIRVSLRPGHSRTCSNVVGTPETTGGRTFGAGRRL